MIDLGVYVVVPGGRVGLVVSSDVPYCPNGRNFCVELSKSPEYICEWHHVSKLTKSNFQEYLKKTAKKQTSLR